MAGYYRTLAFRPIPEVRPSRPRWPHPLTPKGATDALPCDSSPALPTPRRRSAHFERRLGARNRLLRTSTNRMKGEIDFVLVDVRGPRRSRAGHVPGAVNIPHRTMTAGAHGRIPEGHAVRRVLRRPALQRRQQGGDPPRAPRLSGEGDDRRRHRVARRGRSRWSARPARKRGPHNRLPNFVTSLCLVRATGTLDCSSRGRDRRSGCAFGRTGAWAGSWRLGLLAACGQNNTYQAPPPPKVTVAKPVEQKVTRYFEATGNTAAINSANLVARVSGFLTEINYQDGTPVKKGTHLFTIEPEPYQLKLQQAQAAEAGRAGDARSRPKADFERQQELVQRQAASKAAFDNAHRQARQRQGQGVAGAGRHQAGADQSRLHQGRSRRSTASSPRARSRSANWSAAAARRCSPPSSSSIRST